MITRWYIAPVVGLAVGVVVAIASGSGVRREMRHDEHDQRNRVIAAMGEHRAALEGTLNGTLYLTNGLVAYVQSQQHPDPRVIQSMMVSLYRQGHGIRDIAVAPGNRITYLYPLKGNEAALGLYFPDMPEQWPEVKRAIARGVPTLAGPLELRQGGVGLIYRVPVFRGVRHQYWGIVSMVLDEQKLLERAGIVQQRDRLKFALRGKNGTGAAGATFFGDPALFSTDAVKATIRTPGGEWQMAVMPVRGWAHNTRLDWLFGVVMGLAAALGVAVYFSLVSVARHLRAERLAKKNRYELNEAQRIAMIGSWMLDLRSNTLEWSDETFHIFELDPQTSAASYDSFLNLVHPEDREQVHKAFTDSVEKGTPYDITHRLLLPSGRLKYVRERSETFSAPGAKPVVARGTVQDITQLQEAENALRESEERWKFALEGAGDGVWDWNLQTGELFLSAQEMTVLGFEGEGPTHTHIDSWESRQHPDDLLLRREALEAYLEGRSPDYTCEFRTRARDGSWRWVLARGMLLSRTPDGKPLRIIGTHSDITARKHAEQALRESEEKLRVLANTDALTGIANRRHFLEEVEKEMERSDRFHSPGALIMLDIDFFKRINDSYGHAVGDVVLRHFASNTQHRLRKIDLLGRLGGEEFGLFLPGTDAPGAMQFAEELRAHIEETSAPSEKGLISFTVSMGVAEFDPTDPALENLMVRADVALYRAKEGGRNQVQPG